MRTLLVPIVMAAALGAAGCAVPAVDLSPGRFTVTMPAASMEPTIQQGARVDVTEVDEGFEPARGQIVMFTDPGGWLGPDGGGEGSLLKRVIGVAGDTVRCCDDGGRILVNSEPVDEPYISDSDTCAGGGMLLPDRDCAWAAGPVPAGTMFVLGDNRAASVDSRLFLCPDGRPDCSDGPFLDVGLIRGTVDESRL